MSTGDSDRSTPSALTALPSLDTLPVVESGYDQDRVREAFDAFRRHSGQMQAQLRVLQAARSTANVEPTGHAIRMDSLHLIRAAAEFADTLERDAQTASAAQFQRTEEEVRERQRLLQEREAEVERYRGESERQRSEILNAAKAEARELKTKTAAETSQELREAESRGTRLLEQARHQATELTNSARAEVEQTLEWARAQAGTVMARAQKGAEQLLTAAGLGEPALAQIIDAIMTATEASGEARPQPSRPVEAIAGGPAAAPAAPPVSAEPPVSASTPEPDAEPVVEHAAVEDTAAEDTVVEDAAPPAPQAAMPPPVSPAPPVSPEAAPEAPADEDEGRETEQ